MQRPRVAGSALLASLLKTFCERIEKFAERPTAVTDERFLFGCELREGLAQVRNIEQRIVAKSSGSAFGVQDDAGSLSAKSGYGFAFARSGNDANEPGGALRIRHSRHIAQESSLVFGVSGIASAAGFECSETGGMHAGVSVERVHFQAGIVGQHQFPWTVLTVVLGLFSGVAIESGSVLKRWRKKSKPRDWRQLNPKLHRHRSEITKLARVRSGNQDHGISFEFWV